LLLFFKKEDLPYFLLRRATARTGTGRGATSNKANNANPTSVTAMKLSLT